MRYYGLVLLGTILLVGCNEIISESPEVPSEPSFTIFQAPNLNLSEMSKAEISAFFQANDVVRQSGEDILESAGSWQDAHRELVRLFRSNPGAATSPARQVIAARMIEERLLPAPKSAAKQEALSFYTTVLLEAGNPDASILLPALQALKEHWPEARIEEAVAATRTRARAYLDRHQSLLDRVAGCAHCSAQKRAAFKAPEGAEAAQVQRMVRMEAALAGT